MLMILLLAAFAAAPQFAQSSEEPAIDRSVASERQIDTTIEASLRRFAIQFFEDAERYYYNRADLNGDGKSEILVYMVGPRICGSGGCSLFVLANERDEYRIITRMSLVHAPIIVSDNRTNG